MRISIRIRSIPLLAICVIYISSIIVTVTSNKLASYIETRLQVILLLYLMCVILQNLLNKKSALSVIAVLFGIACSFSMFMSNTFTVFNMADALLWPTLLMVTELTWDDDALFEEYRLLKIVGSIILICSVFLTIYNEMGGNAQTNLIYQTYHLTCFLPIYAFLSGQSNKNPKLKLQYIIVSLILGFVLAKRGGIVAVVVAVIAYYIITAIIQRTLSQALKRLVAAFVGFGIVYEIYIFASNRLNWEIFSRLQDLTIETGSSGRNVIWESLLSRYNAGSLIDKLFGFGYNATYNIKTITDGSGVTRGTAAHNDFIGSLFDYGIVSTVFLITFSVVLIVLLIRMVMTKFPYAAIFGMSVSIFFVFAYVSICAITSDISCWLAIFWGIMMKEYRWWINENRVSEHPDINILEE